MIACRMKQLLKLGQQGFSLIELIIVIVVLGILAAFAAPRFSDLGDSSKETATRDELNTLKRAIIGNPAAMAGGEYIDRGFEGDVGFAPSRLEDLGRKPDSVPAYEKLTRLGWNGPYIDTSSGEYLTDSWGTAYDYDQPTRQIISTGGPNNIVISF